MCSVTVCRYAKCIHMQTIIEACGVYVTDGCRIIIEGSKVTRSICTLNEWSSVCVYLAGPYSLGTRDGLLHAVC